MSVSFAGKQMPITRGGGTGAADYDGAKETIPKKPDGSLVFLSLFIASIGKTYFAVKPSILNRKMYSFTVFSICKGSNTLTVLSMYFCESVFNSSAVTFFQLP